MRPPESTRRRDWAQVAEVSQVWQGELIVGRLRASGIEAEILDQTFHQEPLPSVRAFAVVRVLVPMEQLEEAKRALNEGHELVDGDEMASAKDDDDTQ